MMTKSRLEAFSDGVIAIIITIMVLELKVPHDSTINALVKLYPIFLSYVMSFIYIAIYWGNHHHLLHTLQHVNSKIIWSNMGLLFTLSLIPFTTGWMGENHFAQIPVATYAINLLLCAVAYYILQSCIMPHSTQNPRLIEALHKQKIKGISSLILYCLSVGFAFIYPLISGFLFVAIAIIWLVPDRNIERAMKQ